MGIINQQSERDLLSENNAQKVNTQGQIFQGRIVSWLWTCLFFIGIATFTMIIKLNTDLANERAAESREIEETKLGYNISDTSDFLTNEVRLYVMSGNPRHLQNYWYEIETQRTRETVLLRLQELGAPSQELALLDRAKQNSDKLVSTEMRAMKLMLIVTGIAEQSMPESISEFRLSAADKQLTPGDKIELARSIVFDNAYAQAKLDIMGPINEFLWTMQQRIKVETLISQHETNQMLYFCTILLGVSLLLLLLIVWNRLFLRRII